MDRCLVGMFLFPSPAETPGSIWPIAAFYGAVGVLFIVLGRLLIVLPGIWSLIMQKTGCARALQLWLLAGRGRGRLWSPAGE